MAARPGRWSGADGSPEARGEAPVPVAAPELGLDPRAEARPGRWAEVGVSPEPRGEAPAHPAGCGRSAPGGVSGGWGEEPALVAAAGRGPGLAAEAGWPGQGSEGGVPPVPAESASGGEPEGPGDGDGPEGEVAAGVPHTRTGVPYGWYGGPARSDVPAARVDPEAEPEPVHAPAGDDPEPAAVEIPHPQEGPGVAELVARAVARGIREREDAEDDGQRSRLRAGGPRRGSGVTEVPVRLPFRAHPNPPAAPAPASAAPRRTPAAPGRRVPRGDDRLREHRGPVLPGWAAVLVGALALTGCAAVLWRAGVVPAVVVAAFGATPRAYHGLRATHWPPLAFLGVVALVALGGLGRARAGHAWVLTLFGRYRGTVRRTGLTWVSPLLLRRRVDVRLRHWRSDPMPAVDSGGLALQVVVQVVWQVKDTARATLAVEDHTEYLAEQVESAMARVLSQLPADAFHEDAPTLRDAEAVGDALTRMLAAETEAVGIEVYSAQPIRIEYAPEVAEAMRRRRVAAIDAKHRDTVLTSVVDAVDDTVHRLTSRGLVELDDYERKALVKDLTVAFYTGRAE
ncbi:SPFH domain-containing protein [Streptomyces sp. NPDC012746]